MDCTGEGETCNPGSGGCCEENSTCRELSPGAGDYACRPCLFGSDPCNQEDPNNGGCCGLSYCSTNITPGFCRGIRCVAPGPTGNCEVDAECCGADGSGGRCVDHHCCYEEGINCADPSWCCSEVPYCTNGFCSACGTPGSNCTSSSNCCPYNGPTGYCMGNTCSVCQTGPGGSCIPGQGDDNAYCCPGFLCHYPDGFGNKGCYPDSECLWENDVCSGEQTGTCCSGLGCDIGGTNLCAVCMPQGDSCATDPCCTGLECDESKHCVTPVECTPRSDYCSKGSDCCSNTCYSETCICITGGDSCTDDSDCCSGDCQKIGENMICADAMYACSDPQSTWCHSNAECEAYCSGYPTCSDSKGGYCQNSPI
jgi:hypothetical protein